MILVDGLLYPSDFSEQEPIILGVVNYLVRVVSQRNSLESSIIGWPMACNGSLISTRVVV